MRGGVGGARRGVANDVQEWEGFEIRASLINATKLQSDKQQVQIKGRASPFLHSLIDCAVRFAFFKIMGTFPF